MSAGAVRVAVVGGGILGVSTAVQLVRGGADVTLLTETALASGASGRSLSWLNSAGDRPEPYHRLRMAGIDRYRTLHASGQAGDWLGFGGGVRWFAPGGPSAAEVSWTERRRGYASRVVDAQELAALAPELEPGALPGDAILNQGEGWVSLPHLIEHLAAQFVDSGGELVLDAGRCSLLVENGRAAGILGADGGRVDADAVVVACGAGTPAFLAPHGVRIPDASPLAMLVVTSPVGVRLSHVINTPRACLRPDPGGGLAIDHDWYADDLVEGEDGAYSVPPHVVPQLLEEARALLAGHPRLEAASWGIGRKPVPRDGDPVLGELEAVPGCHVAFTHSGATLGLIAGELLADEVLTGEPSPLLDAFRPSRFSA
jgi:glycine/D-amino acid oxidase-like deaminating enzyme